MTVIIAVTTIAVLLFGIPLAVVVERFVEESATLQVEREAVLAAREIPADFSTTTDPVELPIGANATVFGLYDGKGNLVAGVGPNPADADTTRSLANAVVDGETDKTRIVNVPIAADEDVIGVLRAEQPTRAGIARTRRIMTLLGGLAVGVLAVAAGLGWLLASRLARPVLRLRDAAVQLGDGDFAVSIPGSNVPELDEAAAALTATARRLDDLLRRERSFSADASHQLRTPLAGLRAAIETELQFPRTDRAELLHESLSDVDRLERTIDELLAIARTPEAPSKPVDLADVFDRIEADWRKQFAAQGRSFAVASARHFPAAVGRPAALRHALDVLIDNALVHGSGAVHIGTVWSDDTVTIAVSDEGRGLLEPQPTSNTGRHGLTLARRLIEDLPGRLVVPEPGPHPRFEIVLQRARP